ncbi:tetracycline resistance protein [Fictibacillus macauensis ZFHKF-1]|uniref:Tetracycline resistance protein n=1 Tax=Fictibacillus macauensis ZFHKF-1 TaxID=1196324 RepID=I8AEH1_9BACL|nr:MFS transporter [Fictibacillus macauensis]EIT83962.1 tetracycline resistance protein [Fictibacillus macauensis ZFHKF-1]
MTTRRVHALIFTLCFMILSGVANAVIFNVALLDMMKDLHVSNASISWIVVSYTLVLSCGAITYSKLASYIQVKTLLMIGVSLFISGSIVGSLADSYLPVLLARMLQASGGASFIALSMIIANRYMTVEKRNVTLTLIGGCLSIGTGVGFLIGSLLLQNFNWHALFYVMLLPIIALIALVFLAPAGFAQDQKETAPFDVVGLLLTMLFIVPFIIGVKLYASLLILVVLALFLLLSHGKRKRENVFIDLTVFKNGGYSRFVLLGFFNNAALVGLIFMFPLLMLQVFHLSVIETGLWLGAISAFAFLLSLVAQKWPQLLTQSFSLLFVLCLHVLGFVLLALLGTTTLASALIGTTLIYSGYTLLTIITNIGVPTTLAPSKASMGLGVYTLTNFLGMAFGPSIASRLLSGANPFIRSFYGFVGMVLVALVIGLWHRQKRL